jgi:hypothetical protein
MRRPSGANTALLIESVWPARVARCTPLRSHSRAVPSREAVRILLPSRANATLTDPQLGASADKFRAVFGSHHTK